ncbi:class I glutamine amidotransferase-like protein, partial [Basidiobolus meristosporus CBS 931.73]
MAATPFYNIGVMLYPEYDLLDVTGSTRMYGSLPGHFKISYLGEEVGPSPSCQQTSIYCTHSWNNPPPLDIVFVPGGGPGVEVAMANEGFMNALLKICSNTKYIVSICTGSAILAKAGILDGKKATTNKITLPWVTQFGTNVNWVREARWTEDGNIFTSSGVTAGMDLAVRLVQLLVGDHILPLLINISEYRWANDPARDDFTHIIPDVDLKKIKPNGEIVSFQEYCELINLQP